jgi:hypothetical protein
MSDLGEDAQGGSGVRKDGRPYAPDNTREDGSYINGHKRPPIEHRFAVGDGRKRGRRGRGSKGLKTHLEEALRTQQSVRINGEPVKASRQSLMMTTLAARAAAGDLKAATLVIAMIEKMFGFEDRNAGPRKLSAEDQEILTEILGSRLTRSSEPEIEPRERGAGNNRPSPPDAPPHYREADDEEAPDDQRA